MSYLLLICCCCLPLLVILFGGGYLFFKYLNSNKDPHIIRDELRNLLNWTSFITARGVISLIMAFIMFLIAYYSSAEQIPITLLSTMSIFLFALVAIFLTIAIIARIIIALRQNVLKQQISSIQISKQEIVENEPSSIKISLNSKIPWGYLLKIKANLPEKLGGDLKGLATESKEGKISFEATIPYTKRGVYEIGPTTFIYHDAFGFSEIHLTNTSRFKFVVLPEVPQIKKFNFKLSAQSGDIDQNITTFINTDDYYSTRAYIRGDDLRKMHWKLTAKTGDFVIRLPETTTISFKDLSIIILNVIPKITKIQNNVSQNGYLPYKYNNALEYSLDSQVKVAAALIDFALRSHIPVKLYYYSNKKLEEYQPFLDGPSEWKYRLSEIQMIKTKVDLSQLDKLLLPQNAVIMTHSEMNQERLLPILQKARQEKTTIEMLYCPTSEHIKQLLVQQQKNKSKDPTWLRFIKFLLLTKPYFEQNTFEEKLHELFLKKYIYHYNDQDLSEIKNYENNMLSFMQQWDTPYRVFANNDPYMNEIDNIISILETD